MALLKYHTGFRGINNQSCVMLTATNPATNFLEDCSCRFAGTFTSSISKGASKGNTTHRKALHEDQTQHSNNSDDKNDPKDNKVKSKFLKFSSFGMNIPFKIATMNKYLTDTSRKIINSGYSKSGINNTNNSNSAEDFQPDESSVYSLEKTITKMNQSVLSFYDPAYVDETVYKPSSSGEAIAVKTSEILDDDFANSPRSQAPIKSGFPLMSNIIELRKRKTQEKRAEKICRLSLESRTKSLVQALGSAFSTMSRYSRLEELNDHLTTHPECVWEASNERVLPILLKLAASPDKNLKALSNESLSLMGYAKPLKSPGIRLLSIDGGGTRGLVTIEFLKALEKETGKKIYELFDYVCGVSTGALLATMICLYKLPLEECEKMYKRFSIKTFTRNRVVGTTKLVWNHGFYDTQIWEQILRKEMGSTPFIEFSRNPDLPKMSAVSALISPSRMKNHMFRTYNLPPGAQSQYTGHCKHQVWQVIRASSAAPGYFEPFHLGEEVHEDGGILTNNPTALAIHESRLLWENEYFHCVLSLGTGRFKTDDEGPTKLSLKRKISTIVDSACDTEAVHHTLQDLLPGNAYYRFNPYLSEEMFLDEIRTEKMELMQHDARLYTRRNSYKLKALAKRLKEKRKPQQQMYDWMKDVADRVL